MVEFLKNNYKHFVAVAVFAVASMIFYNPALKGYVPMMHDITTHRASSKELVDYHHLTGEASYYTSRTFSGMPSYQITNYYPKAVPRFLYQALTLWLPYPINFMFLLMLSLYILFMCLRVDPWLAIIGSVCFGYFSHFLNILGAGHTSKTHAMAYIPAILGTFYATLRNTRYIRYLIAFTLFLSLQLFANHYQITYYTAILLLFVGGFVFFTDLKSESIGARFKKLGLMLVGAVIAFMISAPGIIMTNDFAKHTIRGKSELTVKPDGKEQNEDDPNKSEGLNRDYITEYSYDKGELLSHLIPNSIESSNQEDWMEEMQRKHRQEFSVLYDTYQQHRGRLDRNGGVFVGNYFGDQTSARPHYFGALFFMLAILGLIYFKGWIKWGLFAACFLAVLLSLGHNLGGSIENMWLTNFFIDNIPLYNKFRAVKMILVIVEVSIPVLAMLGLHQILKDRDAAHQRKLPFLITYGAMLVFMLINIAKPDFIASFYSSNEQKVLNEYPDELRAQANANIKNYKEEIAALQASQDPSAAGRIKQLQQQIATEIPAANQKITMLEKGAKKVYDYRVEAYKSDAWRAFAFVLLGGIVLLLFFFKVINKAVVIPAIGLLLLIDVTGIAGRFDKNEKQGSEYREWVMADDLNKRPVRPTAADRQILQTEMANIPDFQQRHREVLNKLEAAGVIEDNMDKQLAQFTTLNFNSNYRVFKVGNPFNDGETPFLHKATGGYNAAKLKKFQELIDFRLYTEQSQLQDPTATKALNMLNTKYITTPDNPGTREDESQMFRNPFAFGNAWFVKDLHKVKNADEEILAIDDVDVKNNAIVQEKYLEYIPDFQYDSLGTIKQRVLDYKPDHLTYDFKASKPQFVVFSEIYYPDGWNAYIDGELVPHVGVNYVLRGLHVPAGEHVIEFKFEPKKLGTLTTLASIGQWILLLLLLAGAYTWYKDRKQSAGKSDGKA